MIVSFNWDFQWFVCVFVVDSRSIPRKSRPQENGFSQVRLCLIDSTLFEPRQKDCIILGSWTNLVVKGKWMLFVSQWSLHYANTQAQGKIECLRWQKNLFNRKESIDILQQTKRTYLDFHKYELNLKAHKNIYFYKD